jgi:hypothetical protein
MYDPGSNSVGSNGGSDTLSHAMLWPTERVQKSMCPEQTTPCPNLSCIIPTPRLHDIPSQLKQQKQQQKQHQCHHAMQAATAPASSFTHLYLQAWLPHSISLTFTLAFPFALPCAHTAKLLMPPTPAVPMHHLLELSHSQPGHVTYLLYHPQKCSPVFIACSIHYNLISVSFTGSI